MEQLAWLEAGVVPLWGVSRLVELTGVSSLGAVRESWTQEEG